MKSLHALGGISALALAISGCSTWDSMWQTQDNDRVAYADNGGVAYGDNGLAAPADAIHSPPDSDHGLSTSQGTMYDQSGTPVSAYEQNARVGGYTNAPGMAPSSASGYSPDSYNSPQPYTGNANTANAAPSRTGMTLLPPEATTDRAFVRSVQQALIQDGYNAGPVDGILGPRTAEAMRQFQDGNGMEATGRLDSATVAALGIPQPSISGANAAARTSSTMASARMQPRR